MCVFYFWFFIFGFSCTAISSPLDYENNPKFEEIFRIKIWNLPGGTVEVSADEGKNWEKLGTVIYPAERTNPESYSAARWVPDGKVAATAVNAIHVKTGTSTVDGKGEIFSLLPREFLRRPEHYRSYLSPDASIYTDLAAGEGIFGGGYAPFVGNVVLVSRWGEPVIPLPKNYTPALGDRIYIMVEKPVDYPREMVFENRLGGKISLNYFGGMEKMIGEVLRPVLGVGRFEGTRFASVGRIRANHAGVIDVSTSNLDRVGGFQIVPSLHGSSLSSARELKQWMVIGPANISGPFLEGKAPLFKYFLRPQYGEDDLQDDEGWENKLWGRFLVEVKLKDNDKWQPMPVLEFDDYYLSGEIPDWADTALSKVTHFRILFPIEFHEN